MHTLQLDKRIEIQRMQMTKGSSGGMKKAWVHVIAVYAQKRVMSGTERPAVAAAGGQMPVSRVEWVIRDREGITEQMRVLHRAQIYNIRHVKPLADYPGWMVLTTDTGANDG